MTNIALYITFLAITLFVLLLVVLLNSIINKKYLKEIQQLLIYYLTQEKNEEMIQQLERLLKETEQYMCIKKTKRNKNK